MDEIENVWFISITLTFDFKIESQDIDYSAQMNIFHEAFNQLNFHYLSTFEFYIYSFCLRCF